MAALKPLLAQEVPPEWLPYYTLDKQELRGEGALRRLYILVTCPGCGLKRWVGVSGIRFRVPRGPYCLLCVRGQQAGPSQYHPKWRGGRTKVKGYVRVHYSLLPSAEQALFEPMLNDKYILEHRLVIARHLGRPLRGDEIVHHLNGIKGDNRLENLRLLKVENHTSGHGDFYYQQLQEALAKIVRLEQHIRGLENGEG